MRKYIAVFDETGTNNRPQAVAESSFGVGGVIFPSELGASLVEVSKKIGNAVKNGDFKWKDVHNNETARTLFLTGLNGMNPQVHLFAFYTHGACMLHESKRTNDAALVYGIDHTTKISSEGEAFDHLKSFIKYAASCLAAHAWTNQYTLEIYWDRRTDLNQIKESFDQHIEILSKTKRYNGVADLVSFVGQVPTKISPISRLAGVLAGDVWKYFVLHGQRIWPKLDPSGFLGVHETLDPDSPSLIGPICVATVRERIADPYPSNPGAGVMLQGYYKRFLKGENDEYMMTFGDPDGRIGNIGIINGMHWKIYQLPD